MKLVFVSVLLMLCAVVVTGLFHKTATSEPLPAPAAKAAAQTVMFQPGAFQNPSGCGFCHEGIYNAWAGSLHAHAWVDKLFQADYQLASRETGGATDGFCGECHAPVAFRVGQLPPADGSMFDKISKRGVSCDFCHTVSEVVEPFNVRNISSPGPVKRGPRGDSVSPAHETMFSETHVDAKFCGACHNVRHPTSGVTIIDTYDSWLASPYAAAGIRCQDCHMTPGPGVGRNPGRSSVIGAAKQREHVATHYFVGGSSWMFSKLGFPEHARKAEENLKAAARLDLAGQPTESGLELAVSVTNVGAGHTIPTGVTYIRDMWLEVTVTNDQGDIVFRSGHPDAQNRIDPTAAFWRKRFIDAAGNETSKSWLAEGIGYDRRIPPKGTDTETYKITAAGQSFEATVRLLYRSTSQETVDVHFPGQGLQVPSVEMARAQISIAR